MFGIPAAGKAVEAASAVDEVAKVAEDADAVAMDHDVIAAAASGEVVEVGDDVDDYMVRVSSGRLERRKNVQKSGQLHGIKMLCWKC